MTEKKANFYIIVYFISVVLVLGLIGLMLFPGQSPRDVAESVNPLAGSAIVFTIFLPVFFMLWYKYQSRTKGFLKAAGKFGWEYQKYLDLPFLEALATWLKLSEHHPLKGFFPEGVSGKINGWNFVICDGRHKASGYRSYEGDEKKPRPQTLFALHIKEADFPLFGFEPNTLRNRSDPGLTDLDISLKNDPNFSKDHIFYGYDETSISHLFTNEVLALIKSQKNLSIFGYKNHLVMYQRLKQCDPLFFESEIRFLAGIAEIFLKSADAENLSAKESQATENDNAQQKDNVQYW